MATDLRKVYIDTSVFLEHFLDQERAAEARSCLGAMDSGLTQGHLSALVVAESVGAAKIRAPQGIPAKVKNERIDRVRDYFLGTRMRYVDITARAGTLAMQYAIEYQLHGPDALHLALAVMSKCDELHALDGDLLKVGDSIPGLSVCEPHGGPQGSLTDLIVD